MDEAVASELVDLARSKPLAAFDRGRQVLDDGPIDDAVASTILRAMGNAARWVRTIKESVELLEQSIERARSADRDDLVRESQLTLAGSRYLGGDLPAALETLDLAAHGADPDMVAKIEFQRATIMARAGHPERAVAAFNRALAHFEACGDDRFAASTLGNRGNANLERGHSTAADADFRRAQQLFRKLGIEVSVAWMEHNLGRAAGRRGDVVAALNRFRTSEDALSRLNVSASEVQVNRCEVLLQAGLFEEAEGVATGAEAAMATAGLELDRAEAMLARSLALLGRGSYEAAAGHAQRAATLFSEQQRQTWSLQANVVELRSRRAAGTDVATDQAIDVARQLGAAGQHLAAAQAWAVVAGNSPVVALEAIRSLNLPHHAAPLEFRLAEFEILALARLAARDPSGAMAATRAAIELGRNHQLTLGASDIRTAISAQLDAIAQLGLDIRRDVNRPWDLIRWVDRSRTASLNAGFRSLGAPTQFGELLPELRALQLAIRSADPADTLDLLRRQARVQRRLAVAQRMEPVASVRRHQHLPRRLRALCADVTIVQHHRRGSRLGAVVIEKTGARVVDLAPLEEVSTAQAFLAHALGRLILGRDRALAAVLRDAESISRLVVPSIDDRPTVIIPLPQHAGLPWSLLASLADRPVTVAPNLRHWLGSSVSDSTPLDDPAVGLVEGSDLQSGQTEIAGIQRVWEHAESLRAGQADVEAALELLGRVEIAHLACHCHRRLRDGRFAQLRLHDGDLTGFDLERLDRTPALVVLSACEAGLVDTLPGEESTGLATALFGRGTATIIGSTILLPDTVNTAALFIDLHARLAGGRRPSVALFEAQQNRSDPAERAIAQSVSCFGRG